MLLLFCYRLINSTDDTSDTLDDITKKAEYSDEEVEEELNTRLTKDLTFRKHKYKSKSEILHHRNNDLYDSGSDVDPEENTNADSFVEYKDNGFQTNLSKYAKEQFSKTLMNDVTYSQYNTLDVAEQSVGKLKETQLQRISDNIPNDIENLEVSQSSNKKWLDKRQLLENNEINDSSTNIKKEDYTEEEETKYLEDEPVYITANISHDKIYHDTDNAYEEMRDLSEEKKVEKDSQQACEMDLSTVNRSDRSDQPMHNLEKEYLRPETDEMPSMIHRSDEETSNKNDVQNIEIQNKLNASEDIDALSNKVPISQTEQSNGAKNERTEMKQASEKKKIINYNKEKLLATMKAIDDNENIEFLSQGFRNHNVNRMQIMENLHRGLPAHSKPKRDIIRDMFEDNHIESKVRGTCSKSH